MLEWSTLLHPELEFIKSRKYRNGYLWIVKKKRQSCEICPKCSTASKVLYGRAKVLLREEDIRDVPLWLEVHKHRYFCKTCKKPFTEPVAGVFPKRRTTQRFRRSIMNRCLRSVNLLQVQHQLCCSSGLVHQIFYEQLSIKLRERKGISWPSRIGIDEHFFKRHRGFREFVTVFIDFNKNKLFEVALTKNKKQLLEQLKNIPGREKVRVVCIDMASGYRSFIKEFFPNAKIVVDKFHAVRLLHPQIIKKRREIQGHKQDLRTRRLLLKNRKDLEYWLKNDIDRYLKQYPELDELYRAKERLHLFYRTKGYDKAKNSLLKFIEDLKKSTNPGLLKLRRTLKNWFWELLAYFKYRVTNGPTEAINGRAKLLQRRACGYKSFKNYRLAMLSACAF